MKYHCAICNRERSADQVTLFKVKPMEVNALAKISGGGEVPKEVAVCKGCSSLVSNKGSALQILRGTLISGFRAAGVPLSRAEAAADAFCKKLADASSNTTTS